MLFWCFFSSSGIFKYIIDCSTCDAINPVQHTSLKMGVTKADRHCDLGCLFTESPDWRERKKKKGQLMTHKTFDYCSVLLLESYF